MIYYDIMNTKVSIVKCAAYDTAELYQALKEAAQAAGIPDVAGKRVLLKPNILMDAAPEKAITTHPAFLEAVIRLVREWGAAKILVGDSPGLQGRNFTARVSGLGDTARKNNTQWVDFTQGKIEVECPQAKVQRRFSLSSVINEVDLIINLPKLKTHQLMYYTGAIKNMFGLIPSVAKSPYHVRYSTREAFASMIVDLNLLEKPVYAFMDAVTAMEGHGPSGGNPREVGLVLASPNFLAMDAVACAIIGYPAEKIPTNREALNRKKWLQDFSEIEYPLLKPDDVRIPDFAKIPFKKSRSQLMDFLVPRSLKKIRENKSTLPEINHTVCVRCGDCIKICASEALNFSEQGGEKKVEINSQRCIRCYCCHEVCPAKAIKV